MPLVAFVDDRPGLGVGLVVHLAAIVLPPLFFAAARSRWRFSLRSLLIAATCVACFIGLTMNEWRVFDDGPIGSFFLFMHVARDFAFTAAVVFLLSLIFSWSIHGLLTLPRAKLR